MLGSIITLTLFLKLGLNLNFIIATLLFYTLITLSFIDFKYKAVPDYLLMIALIFAFFLTNFSIQYAFMFAGAFVLLELFVTFYIQNIKAKITKNEELKTQRAMGEGDIPIIAIIGGLVGIKLGLITIFLGALFAIIPAILNSIIKKEIETPFIPFLSLALFVTYVWHEPIIKIFEITIK